MHIRQDTEARWLLKCFTAAPGHQRLTPVRWFVLLASPRISLVPPVSQNSRDEKLRGMLEVVMPGVLDQRVKPDQRKMLLISCLHQCGLDVCHSINPVRRVFDIPLLISVGLV